MPATIISRTQRFHFKKLSLTVIVGKLKNIIKAENIKISDAALELIAAVSGGSFRDAESLLDQIASLEQQETKGKETKIDHIMQNQSAMSELKLWILCKALVE